MLAVYSFLPFHKIMCALADSAQATVSTVDGGDDTVLSQEVSGELGRFVTCEEYSSLAANPYFVFARRWKESRV